MAASRNEVLACASCESCGQAYKAQPLGANWKEKSTISPRNGSSPLRERVPLFSTFVSFG